MRKFNYKQYRDIRLPNSLVKTLNLINQYKGKHDLFVKQKPEVLKKLVEIAKIQSIDSSNRIEGIKTSNKRLKEIVEKKSKPQNRSEQEIAGYRDVLSVIHEAHDTIKITPNYILQLHKMLLDKSQDPMRGKFKNTNNFIEEIKDNGERIIRFAPPPPFETPIYIEEICKQYIEEINQNKSDQLVLIFIFILDFLCIHPFNDGNGRISRLLTLLLLYQINFEVGKYISIERLIENRKDRYYDTLQESSKEWSNGKNEVLHFVDYMLTIILEAYQLFETRAINTSIKNKSKPDKIKELFDVTIGYLTRAKISELCPGISSSTIRQTLTKLVKSRYIKKVGDNKTAKYIRRR